MKLIKKSWVLVLAAVIIFSSHPGFCSKILQTYNGIFPNGSDPETQQTFLLLLEKSCRVKFNVKDSIGNFLPQINVLEVNLTSKTEVSDKNPSGITEANLPEEGIYEIKVGFNKAESASSKGDLKFSLEVEEIGASRERALPKSEGTKNRAGSKDVPQEDKNLEPPSIDIKKPEIVSHPSQTPLNTPKEKGELSGSTSEFQTSETQKNPIVSAPGLRGLASATLTTQPVSDSNVPSASKLSTGTNASTNTSESSQVSVSPGTPAPMTTKVSTSGEATVATPGMPGKAPTVSSPVSTSIQTISTAQVSTPAVDSWKVSGFYPENDCFIDPYKPVEIVFNKDIPENVSLDSLISVSLKNAPNLLKKVDGQIYKPSGNSLDFLTKRLLYGVKYYVKVFDPGDLTKTICEFKFQTYPKVKIDLKKGPDGLETDLNWPINQGILSNEDSQVVKLDKTEIVISAKEGEVLKFKPDSSISPFGSFDNFSYQGRPFGLTIFVPKEKIESFSPPFVCEIFVQMVGRNNPLLVAKSQLIYDKDAKEASVVTSSSILSNIQTTGISISSLTSVVSPKLGGSESASLTPPLVGPISSNGITGISSPQTTAISTDSSTVVGTAVAKPELTTALTPTVSPVSTSAEIPGKNPITEPITTTGATAVQNSTIATITMAIPESTPSSVVATIPGDIPAPTSLNASNAIFTGSLAATDSSTMVATSIVASETITSAKSTGASGTTSGAGLPVTTNLVDDVDDKLGNEVAEEPEAVVQKPFTPVAKMPLNAKVSLVNSFSLKDSDKENVLSWPRDLAFGNDGSLWLVDSQSRRIFRFNDQGKLIKAFGKKGKSQGGLGFPVYISVDDKSVFVSDTSSHNVHVFDLEGTFLQDIGTWGTKPGQLDLPHGIALNGNELWVADMGNKRVNVFSTNGEFKNYFGKQGDLAGFITTPIAISFVPQGVWVLENLKGKLQFFAANNGKLKSAFLIGTRDALNLKSDKWGGLWVVDSEGGSVLRLSQDGKLLTRIATPLKAGKWIPTSVAVRSDGLIAIADGQMKTIHLFKME
ncbi:MAG: hypothetical protein HQM08_25535 [Candidatus Riflebacteria bacterium]|nr:hypothetical protein [Candidatus Riflebacteria bacterium]